MLTKSLKEILYSCPIDVVFAGWRTNTLALGQNGWDLSMEQGRSMYGEYEMQLAMRHGNKEHAMYMVSQRVQIPYGAIGARMDDPIVFSKFIATICFHIQYAANDIKFIHVPAHTTGKWMRDGFQAIDPVPQWGRQEESIRDFKFFKTVNHDVKDLIVSPDKVPELMDLILKLQAPEQEQIRHREKQRQNLSDYRDGTVFGNPGRDVQAQIITLAV